MFTIKKQSNEHIIYILRHAKSQRADKCLNDYDRSLTKRGVRQARDFARFLLDNHASIDAIYASGAPRGRDTAGIVAKDLDVMFENIHLDRRFYGTTTRRWIGCLQHLDDVKIKQVLLVGHNPEMQQLVQRLLGIKEVELPPSGGVAIKYKGSWSRLATARSGCSLLESHYPKKYDHLRPEYTQLAEEVMRLIKKTFPTRLHHEVLEKSLQPRLMASFGKAHQAADNRKKKENKTPAQVVQPLIVETVAEGVNPKKLEPAQPVKKVIAASAKKAEPEKKPEKKVGKAKASRARPNRSVTRVAEKKATPAKNVNKTTATKKKAAVAKKTRVNKKVAVKRNTPAKTQSRRAAVNTKKTAGKPGVKSTRDRLYAKNTSNSLKK